MAASTNYALTGDSVPSGLAFDGKKKLIVTADFTGNTISPADVETKAGYNDGKKDAKVKANAITEIDASAASKAIKIVGGSKATSVTLSAGDTVVGGAGADKFYGSKGANTFVLGEGADQIGVAPKKNETDHSTRYGENDVISISAAFDKLTFSDAPAKQSVVITAPSGNKTVKYTVFKDKVDRPLTIVDSTGTEHYYGTDGSNSSLDAKGTTLTIKDGNGTVEAGSFAAGAKIIDATAIGEKVYLVGNGAANQISLGSGGGTVYGGYDSAKKKATADVIYRNPNGTNAVTYYFDSLAGSDNIVGYKAGDTIKIAAGTATAISSGNIKDGGTGKDVVITYSGKEKITVKNNTASLITMDVNGKPQYIGVDVAKSEGDLFTIEDVGFDAKRTSLVLGGNAEGEIGVQGWKQVEGYTGNATDTALQALSDKLLGIDASAATAEGGLIIKGHATKGSVLKAAATGETTLISGSGADNLYAGGGYDVFLVDVTAVTTGAYNVGKDVIYNIEGNDTTTDLIVLKGYDSAVHNAVAIDAKGVITFTDDKNDMKTNSITVKTFKPAKGATAQQVVVVDEKGNVLASRSNVEMPHPTGLNVTAKAGLTTDGDFDGSYEYGTYAKGAVVEIETGVIDDSKGAGLYEEATSATLDSNDYGGSTKAIHAENVGGWLSELYIKGNETAKTEIYAPTRKIGDKYTYVETDSNGKITNKEADASKMSVTLEGGKGADTFHRDTDASAVSVTYIIDVANGGKDVISDYNPDLDTIVLTNLPASLTNQATLNAAVKNDADHSNSTLAEAFNKLYIKNAVLDKNDDVIVTFDKTNTLTIKNGATRALTFVNGDLVDEDGNYSITAEYGHTLPSGLKYDSSKHTAINGLSTLEIGSAEDGDFDGTINLKDSLYYTTVKTVSLGSASVAANLYGSTIANELYAGTGGGKLFGGSTAGLKDAKGKALKATADKLYGNTGSDTFMYMAGEGADVIGNTRTAYTLFDENDTLILASKNGTVLSRDQVNITAKDKNLTIVIDGSSDKFTVNKKDTDTAVHIQLANAIDDAGNYTLSNEEDGNFIYGMDPTKFAGTLNFKKNSLEIAGAGVTDSSYNETTSETTYTYLQDGDAKLAKVNLGNVSSGLKTIDVKAGADTRVNIIGDQLTGAALTVHMGVGGGTVSGGRSANKKTDKNGNVTVTYKTTADKFYADEHATGGTTFVLDKYSGKDNIYNYSATRGDVLYLADGANDVEVQMVKGGLKFSYDKDNYVIINDKDVSDKFDVRISGVYYGYATTVNGTASTINAVIDGRYYGWDTNTKNSTKLIAHYAGDSLRNEDWSYDNGAYHYSKNTTAFTLQGSLQDADNDYIPDGVTATPDSNIAFNTEYYVDPQSFHIAGHYGTTTLSAGDMLNINGVNYTLYDTDGNLDNGLELTYNNFVKTGSNRVVHYGVNGTALDLDGTVDSGSNFTVTGSFKDNNQGKDASLEADNFLTKFAYNSTSKKISLYGSSDTDLSKTTIDLNPTVAADKDAAAAYTVEIGAKNAADAKATYKLYDGDGDASTGFELLRTDIATANNWSLHTGADALGSVQADGTGVWSFTDNNTKFRIGVESALKPDAQGLPAGVTVDTDTSWTAVTFDNGLTVANQGFAKTSGNDFINFGALADDGTTVIDYANNDVGGLNQFTLSGAITDASSLSGDLADFTYDSSNKKLTIIDSVASVFDTDTHLQFSTKAIEAMSDSVNAIAAQTIEIKTVADASTVVATYKLYDGDGIAPNGSELLRTDVAAAKNWELLTGSSDNYRVIDTKTGYVHQSNGTGFWNYNNTISGIGYGFVVSSEAGVKAAADGTPIGISVGGNENNGLTITIDSDAGIKPAHILFNDNTNFGSETGAVHIAGLAEGTEFTIGYANDVYQLAQLDRNTVNGYELLKVDPAGGWSIKDGAWTFDNTTIHWTDKGTTYSTQSSIPAVQFTIDSDANLAIADDGTPVGVTVTADRTSKNKTLGTVYGIEFGAGYDSLKDYISFATLPTGNIDGTSHISGIASGTSTIQTFPIGDNEYYLVDLDGSADGNYELLQMNSNWLRTADGWKYFKDGDAKRVDGVGDISITSAVFAALDGAPRGIKVEADEESKNVKVTIDSTIGPISDNKKDTAGYVSVVLTEDDLRFGTTTKVNDAEGLHILSKNAGLFGAGATVQAYRGSDANATKYILANLDRDASNGYELLAPNEAGWTFNNGVDAQGKADTLHPVGSWTYSTDAKVGSLTGAFTFDISADANLYGKSEKDGTPSMVTVTAATTANSSDITISAAEGFNLGNLIFTKDVADNTFLDTGGVHFAGGAFKAQDNVYISDANGTVSSYRLTDLDGKSDTFELLKVAEPDYWTVSADTSDRTKRVWTYANTAIGINSLTIDAANNLVAGTDGIPEGISIDVQTVAGGYAATITVDSGEGVAVATSNVVLASSLTFSLDTAMATGSNTKLHFVGFNTDTTLNVNNENYVLANLDTNTADHELLKVNDYWTLYSEMTTIDNEEVAAGTWVYGNTNVNVTLDAAAGWVNGAETIVPANADGAPKGITIDGFNVTLDSSALNINTTTGSGDAAVTSTADSFNSKIAFASNSTVGKDGLHISGIDVGTKITLSANSKDSAYYFADLDNNTVNGYEFTPQNTNWTRTTEGWDYTDSTTGFNIAMSIASIIDPVMYNDTSSNLPVGSPKNVKITMPTGGTHSDTIEFTAFTGQSSLVSFDSIVAGAAGLHIKGLANGDSFTVGSDSDTAKVYSLKELNGNSSTGLELLVQDANWSLENSGTGSVVREWTYSGDNGLTFTVDTMTGVAQGLTPKDSDTGKPVGITVTSNMDTGAASTTVVSQIIEFATTGMSTTGESPAAIIASLDLLKGASLAADDLTKLHFKGFAGASTTDGTDYAYASDTSKMFTIGGKKYYLADVDGNADNGFELVQNDAHWHRYETGWYYNNSDTANQHLFFRIDKGSGAVLSAEKEDGEYYTGKPLGVEVATVRTVGPIAAHNEITIATNTTIDLVFSTATSVANTRIIYESVTGGNPNSSTPEYQFKFFSADGKVGSAAPTESASDTKYYLAHVDTNEDTWEFVRENANWHRYENGWSYTGTNDSKTFSFFITSTGPEPLDTGAPKGITVTTSTRVITIASDTANFGYGDANLRAKTAADNLIFFKDSTIGAYNQEGATSTHIVFTGYNGSKLYPLNVRKFDADMSAVKDITTLTDESTVITVTNGNTQSTVRAGSFALNNADLSTVTGLELTYNGWADTVIGTGSGNGAYAYQDGWKSAATDANNISFVLKGSAFGTTTTTEDGLTYTNVRGFESANAKGIVFSDGDGDSTKTVSDFKVGSFQVYGSGTTNSGSFIDGQATVKAYDKGSIGVTFTLRDVTGDTALELTNNGWAKIAEDQMLYASDTVQFTLKGYASSSSIDTDNNLIPDNVVNAKFANGMLNVSLSNPESGNKWDNLAFVFAEGQSDAMIEKINISVLSDTGVYVHGNTEGAYSITSSNSHSNSLMVSWVKTENEGDQLAAGDGWVSSGYDIDDLLGGVTGSSPDTVSELDEILDAKPIGTEVSTTFDPDAALTEVGTDKTIRSLTYGARHKARK